MRKGASWKSGRGASATSEAILHRDVETDTKVTTQVLPEGRSVIAAIGINHYQKWAHLRNAVGDAQGTLEIFSKLGFEQIAEPLFDEAATADALRSLVSDDLPRKLKETDSLVLFFAGHGYTRTDKLPGGDVAKTGYLIPVDGDTSEGSSVRWIRLESWLSDIALLPARHILVILDACHSGIALGSVIRWRGASRVSSNAIKRLNSRPSRRVITSALDDQRALDSGPIRGHSLFTGCLIETLTDGLISKGGSAITGSELGLHLQQRVSSYPLSEQTPDFGTLENDKRGELVICFPPGDSSVAGGLGGSAEKLPAQGAPAGTPSSGPRRQQLAWAVTSSIAAAGLIWVAGILFRTGPRATEGDADIRGSGRGSTFPNIQQKQDLNPWLRIPGRNVEMQTHEVTREEFLRFVSSQNLSEPPWNSLEAIPGQHLLPATSITKDEASAYCEWIGARLPTREEWEAVAMEIEQLPQEVATCRSPRPVGTSREPSTRVGFKDLGSNVAEFLADEPMVGGFECNRSLAEISAHIRKREWSSSVREASSEFYGFRCTRRVQ